jgi:adenine specific DNA methylase Mod
MNEYIIGNNLDILDTINDKFDFVYIDPPYNTGRNFGDFDDRFENTQTFIDFLKLRIQKIFNKMNDNANLVLHIDPTASHYCKVMLDEIFGIKNFQNEIIWCTNGMKKVKKKLMRSHDVLLVYSKKKSKSYFKPMYVPHQLNSKKKYVDDGTGRGPYNTSAAVNSQPDVIVRMNLRYEWNGHQKQWWVSKEKMQELHDDNRLVYNAAGIPRIKRYYSELSGIPIKDVWVDISSTQIGEKMDYATQKPIKLIERLLHLYTKENNNCIDFFAGTGVLGRACIKLNRNYLLIDINNDGKNLFESSIKAKE